AHRHRAGRGAHAAGRAVRLSLDRGRGNRRGGTGSCRRRRGGAAMTTVRVGTAAASASDDGVLGFVDVDGVPRAVPVRGDLTCVASGPDGLWFGTAGAHLRR